MARERVAVKVKFLPQNVEFEIKPNESVLHVAQDHGIYIKSVCKGVPSCAECRVRILEGDHNVLPPGSEELSLIGTGHFIDRRRLSCQLKCFGDITIDMNEQIAKENGTIVGRKKKLAVKDDRVEQAVVRRSENTSESEEGDTSEGGAPLGDGAPRPPREERDRGSGRDRGPRENRGGPRPQGAGGSQSQSRPESRGPRPERPSQGPREGGGKRRRRRRGKGGGPGAGPSGGSRPDGEPSSGPSRPTPSASKPPNPGQS